MARAVVLLSLLVPVAPALAHAAWPVYLQVDEIRAGEFRMRWQVPRVLPESAVPEPALPATCVATGAVRAEPVAGAFAFQRTVRCTALRGERIGLRWPQHNPALTTLYRVAFADGEVMSHVGAPDERDWRLPAARSRWHAAADYAGLGVHHIMTGSDHLLFVLCLMFVAGTGRRLLLAITGFTLGHSLTLALAALDLVRVPTAPVEACIALSIAMLAAEIVRNRPHTLAWRSPGLVSVAFGLLHGFGFASALRDTGLPHGDVPLALAAFNLGVEIGQLAFVAAVLALAVLVRRALLAGPWPAPMAVPARLRALLAYACGATAAFWFIQRLAAF
ncbi:MAG: HupE/UreJ family protein [Gammaproteobacteria bacterium]